jgi:hypothetical protein
MCSPFCRQHKYKQATAKEIIMFAKYQGSEKHHVAFTKEPPQTKQKIDLGMALMNIP